VRGEIHRALNERIALNQASQEGWNMNNLVPYGMEVPVLPSARTRIARGRFRPSLFRRYTDEPGKLAICVAIAVFMLVVALELKSPGPTTLKADADSAEARKLAQAQQNQNALPPGHSAVDTGRSCCGRERLPTRWCRIEALRRPRFQPRLEKGAARELDQADVSQVLNDRLSHRSRGS